MINLKTRVIKIQNAHYFFSLTVQNTFKIRKTAYFQSPAVDVKRIMISISLAAYVV